jgi:hypothetical protein
MAGATGSVEVMFSVSAAGTTTVQRVSGPDLLKEAAKEAVESWVFRRTRADRAYLVAVFSYGEDRATAVVRPQLAPGGSSAAALPAPAAAPQAPRPEPPSAPAP